MVENLLTRAQRESTTAILRELTSTEAPLEIAENAAEFADRMIEVIRVQSPLDALPACIKRCTSCCYLHTTASVPEVILIAEKLRSDEAAIDLKAFLERIAKHIAGTAGLSAAQRNRLRLQCPLLVDGECSVYEARPLVCRGWNSLDASRCHADLSDPGEGLLAVLNVKQYVTANQIAQGMADAIQDAGLDAHPLDMVRGLLIALTEEDSAEQWSGGGNSFATAVNERVFLSVKHSFE